MVVPMIEVAVHVKHLVESTKVTVIGTTNAVETLSVVKTIVLYVSHLELTAAHINRMCMPLTLMFGHFHFSLFTIKV